MVRDGRRIASRVIRSAGRVQGILLSSFGPMSVIGGDYLYCEEFV